MTKPEIVFLMYHELELPGRKLVQSDPGYTRYVLSESAFGRQLEWLKQNNWLGLCVSDALNFPSRPSVAITFEEWFPGDVLYHHRISRAHRLSFARSPEGTIGCGI